MNIPNRRSILKGLSLGAGSVVLQPMMQSIAAQAEGRAGPKRVIFLIEGNGMNPAHLQPKGLKREHLQRGVDTLIDVPLADYELPNPIAALNPFKDRLTIIQGLSHKIASGRGHSPEYGSLGCHAGNLGPVSQTIDAALAAQLGGVVPHLGLALTPNPDQIVDYSVSTVAKGKPLPFHCQPELAFQSLFGSAAGGDAAKIPFLRKNLMDHMASDIKRVQSRLAGPEREHVERYLESYETMLDRHHGIEGIEDQLVANMPITDKFKSRVETDRLEAQCEMAVSSLLSGLTNVVTIGAVSGNKYIQWSGLGHTLRTNAIGHGGGENGKTSDDLQIEIRKFHIERLVALAKRLDSVKEGDGTVLDNTLIIYMSDFGDKHHPSYTRWPVVMLGNLGGALKTNGRFLEYPRYGRPGHKTMGTLYTSLLHAVGDKREKFGNVDLGIDKEATHGPLAEILG